MGLFSQIILLKVKMAQSVQVFGRKKTATAVAFCKRGNGMIKVNGRPLDLVQPETLRMKVQEPLLLLGKERFAGIDIRVRVKGGGQVAQLYAIRQAISKPIVAYYQKFVEIIEKRDQGSPGAIRQVTSGSRPKKMRG